MLRPQHVEQKQPYVDDSCKLLLHFNGQSGTQQFIDSSNIPKVVTAFGNACLSNTHYRFNGTAGYFDGNGDYSTVPHSSDFSLSNKIFTIAGWFYFSNVSAGRTLVAKRQDSSNEWALIWSYTGGYLRFASHSGGSYEMDFHTSSWAPTVNIWYHIALIFDGSSPYIYINGISQSITIDVNTSITDNNGSLYIGYSPDWYTFNGYIGELAIWKGLAKPIGMLYPQLRPYGYPIGGT